MTGLAKTGERVIPDNFESEEEYLIFLQHLSAYEYAAEKIKGGLVLEIGSGEGYGTDLLSKKAKEIIGLDVDKKVVEHADEKYGSKNCLFRFYDGRKLPFRDEYFDAIVSFQVIEHIKDDLNFIREVRRVLKRGGYFFLTTPNKTYRLPPGQKPYNRFHIREYYPEELRRLLETAFKDIKLSGIGANEEIRRIEISRVKQNLRIVSLDPFNIRRIMPEFIKPAVIRMIRKIFLRKKISGNARRYSLNDYYITDNQLDSSLDLLAISKKS